MNISDLSNQITTLILNSICAQVSELLEKEFKAQKLNVDVKNIMSKVKLQESTVVEKKTPVPKKATTKVEKDGPKCGAILGGKAKNKGQPCGKPAAYPDEKGVENCRCKTHMPKGDKEKTVPKPKTGGKKTTTGLVKEDGAKSTLEEVIAADELNNILKEFTVDKEEDAKTPDLE